nr:MAG: hypothetical protein DIU68_13230 [Chloroflexota bacterium]
MDAMQWQQNRQYGTFEPYDLNLEYRRELMRQAEHARLLRLVRSTQRQPGLHRAVMAWSGRRLVAVGRYLLNLADSAPEPANAHQSYLR